MNDAAQNLQSPLNRKSLSLSRRGAWGQVTVAAVLITILPFLILAWAWKSHLDGNPLPPLAAWCVGGVVFLVITLGYTLLFKYPVSIVRLRHYLSTIASGGIPEQVTLTEDEDDLAAVQHYMERIVNMAEDRIMLIEKRHEVELGAERQRVMIESIGAMCHHVGQPATVMSMCIYRLKHNPSPEETPVILAECEAAFDSMAEILDQLRATSQYASEPYLQPVPGSPETPAKPGVRIIKV
ncbi:MAG: hypothetical protein WCI03_14130 [bacterium]|jgi:hypothetical protein